MKKLLMGGTDFLLSEQCLLDINYANTDNNEFVYFAFSTDKLLFTFEIEVDIDDAYVADAEFDFDKITLLSDFDKLETSPTTQDGVYFIKVKVENLMNPDIKTIEFGETIFTIVGDFPDFTIVADGIDDDFGTSYDVNSQNELVRMISIFNNQYVGE